MSSLDWTAVRWTSPQSGPFDSNSAYPQDTGMLRTWMHLVSGYALLGTLKRIIRMGVFYV